MAATGLVAFRLSALYASPLGQVADAGTQGAYRLVPLCIRQGSILPGHQILFYLPCYFTSEGEGISVCCTGCGCLPLKRFSPSQKITVYRRSQECGCEHAADNACADGILCPEPAPELIARGNTPRTKARDVINMGRSLKRAASFVASISSVPCSICSFANSTIRMRSWPKGR